MSSKTQLKKKITCIFFLISLISCAAQPNLTTSGVLNLENKYNLLSNNISNKNDVINLLGETIIKEYPNDLIWLYVETEKKTSFLGKKVTTKNNILILEFDSKGILVSKKILDKQKMKELELEELTTKNYGVNESFSKKFFASMRKRFHNKTNSQANK